MERRYQIFVSSTFGLARRASTGDTGAPRVGLHPAGMELFPASDETKWSLITRVIDDCDYYIVIIGGRYGSVDETGISYTEREYDYAVNAESRFSHFSTARLMPFPPGRQNLRPKPGRSSMCLGKRPSGGCVAFGRQLMSSAA